MLHLKLYETRFVCVVRVVLQMIYIVQKYSLKVQEPHEGWHGRYTIDYTIHNIVDFGIHEYELLIGLIVDFYSSTPYSVHIVQCIPS